jgi:hypothetical protein
MMLEPLLTLNLKEESKGNRIPPLELGEVGVWQDQFSGQKLINTTECYFFWVSPSVCYSKPIGFEQLIEWSSL